MIKKRCRTCNGSGRVMGGGMLQQDCDDCDGRGKIYEDEPRTEAVPAVDKTSKEYKNAIKQIKKIGKDITDEEADKMFDEAWEKAK